ncbi:nitroreductase family protein [Mycolicibacterium baixiangningiae]|uniref:nitroreductase family protein n=1 Tax=Mycolicibacterium baixiangningiae TaxID=2761578 RepID=UPI0018672E01|nr:nitroreductase family protein [Mycolicibacterium baixiangningiae]
MKRNTTRSKQQVKKVLQKIRLRYLAHKDVARFSRTASFSIFDTDYEQVVSRIMYNVHAIEKGLARTADFRPGFGRKALSDLNDTLVVYRTAGHDLDGFAYGQGVSILQRYRELHAKFDHDVSFLEEIVDPVFLDAVADRGVAGTKILRRAEKQDNDQKNFYQLAAGRSSVRQFSGRPIDTSKVMAALRAAEKTPSVCNRQGWRVYWVEDKDLAARVLEHQRGFGQRLMPEVLLTITVSNSTFLSPVERNEAFVDGGLFSMSVMYGLEHEGLAAVPLNAMMYYKDQAAVRELLSIDDSEMITMFIAIGDFPEETVVPISDRKPAASFVRRRGEGSSAAQPAVIAGQ